MTCHGRAELLGWLREPNQKHHHQNRVPLKAPVDILSSIMSNAESKTQIETPIVDASQPPSERAEREIAPGIYFTPAPKRNEGTASNPHGIPEPPDVQNMTRDELESEYRSTSKSIQKLGESNDIMKQCDPNSEDPVLVEAIRENVDIIVRRKLRMLLVKARLDYLIRAQPHIRSSRVATRSANTNNTALATTIQPPAVQSPPQPAADPAGLDL